MDYTHYWWGPWTMFPVIMPVILVVVLVVCLYFIFGRGSRSYPEPPQAHYPDAALNILKERYARGEISKEEFDRMKQDILT
jgi:putative membrane protein